MLAPNKLKAMTLCKEGQTNYSIGRASRRTVEMSKVKDYKGRVLALFRGEIRKDRLLKTV
jgi:hypothetical protein